MITHSKTCFKFKAILATILAIVLAASPLNLGVFASGEDSPNMSSLALGLSDSSEDNLEEYLISSKEDLFKFAERVNSGDSMKDYLVKLTQDIELSVSEQWTPIGKDATNPFSGHFDGNGHTIKGFQVDVTTEGGLFGYLSDATIKKLIITDFVAPNSTFGFFFFASNSTISLSKTGQNAMMSSFAMSRGTRAATEYPTPIAPGGTTFNIASTAALSAFATDVNANTPTAVSADIIVDSDISAAGVPSINGFKGTFVGLSKDNMPVITNLSNSLFDNTDGATIENLIISGSNVTGAGNNGALVGTATNTQISNIVVRDSNIVSSSTFAGGVVGEMLYVHSPSMTTPSIQNVLVTGSTITGFNSGGVVGNSHSLIVSHSTVYNTTITGYANAGGIVGYALGAGSSFSTIDQNIVLGSKVLGSFVSNGAGVANVNGPYIAVTNNIVADTFIDIGLTRAIGATGQTGGVQYLFTDSPHTQPMVMLTSGVPYVINNYWDSLVDHKGVAPSSPTAGDNMGYDVNYLTNGIWTPNNNMWVAGSTTGSYPEISSLSNSNTDGVSSISGAAAVALTTTHDGENYKDGARELHLMRKTGVSGYDIDWKELGALRTTPGIIVTDASDRYILSTSDNAGKTIPVLTATVNGYKKEFTGITLIDSFLDEDMAVRNANRGEHPSSRSISFKFNDSVEINPDVEGLIELYVKRSGNWSDRPEQTMPAIAGETRFKLITKQTLELNFSLAPGKEYKLVIPAGMVREEVSNNISLKDEILFNTIAQNSPVIEAVSTLEWPNTKALTESDLTSLIKVYLQEGSSELFGTTTLLNSSMWDSSNVMASMTTVLNNDATAFPSGVNSSKYILSDSSLISVTPNAGTYNMYIMAKNRFGLTSTKIVTISVIGSPEWQSPPKNTVHIPWTSSKDAIISAAKQGAVAYIPEKDSSGNSINLPTGVTAVYDEKELEKATGVNMKNVPTHINFTLIPSDKTGKPTTDTSLHIPVTIFLDHHLSWTITPSPITMSITTEKNVEKRLDYIPRNYTDKEIEITYEHWENDYKIPGTYYVDIESDKQTTTQCPDPKCEDSKNHPNDRVSDTVVVNIVKMLGEEYQTFWGDSLKEFMVGGHSENVVTVQPKSYMLPSYVPETLNKQTYGRMEINYFDEYRWSLYSSTMDTTYNWSDYYSLQIQAINNPKVTALLDGKNNALQFEFAHTGKLFGTVEFDINLSKAKTSIKNMPTDNLGLYKYNSQTNKLELVSDVIVTNKTWASATVSELYPTTYVLKSKGSSDKISKFEPDSLQKYYLALRPTDRTINKLADPNPSSIRNMSSSDTSSMYQTLGATPNNTFGSNEEGVKKGINLVIPLVGIGIVALAAVGFIVYRKLNMGKGGK